MKWALFSLLVIHGLIHVMGVAKGFGWADIPAISTPISRSAGWWWLLATVLFLATAGTLLPGWSGWWMFGIPAVLLSQVLIIMTWTDSRWGTLANVILLLPLLAAYGQWQWNRQVEQEFRAFQAIPSMAIHATPMDSLPAVVRQWIRHSGFTSDIPKEVAIRQDGQLRLNAHGRWMPFEARQVFSPRQPGFLWRTHVYLPARLPILGRDAFRDGRGSMLIKLLGLIPIADARGPEIDQGTMLRYLGETVWFPAGALHPGITWTAIDETRARATMTLNDLTVEGVFTFTPEGQFEQFTAKRYYDRGGRSTLEDWLITARPNGYRTFDGVRVPASLEATWLLPEGDFTWMHLEITALEITP